MHATRLRLPIPSAAWFNAVLKGVLTGPLIGGAPYNLFIFPIPFAYLLGAVPALICSGFVAAWVLMQPPTHQPIPKWAIRLIALVGAVIGAVVWGALLDRSWSSSTSRNAEMTIISLIHGIPAALILAPYWVRHITHPKTRANEHS